MRRLTFCLAIAVAAASSSIAPARASSAHGVVTTTRSGCDYFLVSTKLGFDLLEWFGGATPDRGDVLIGSYETYGFHDVYDKTQDSSVHVWVEDYWLDSDGAFDKLNEHCE